MMGSYQNANNLLEALIIYSLCIEGGNYNPNSKEKAEIVKVVLDDLINRLKSGSSLQDFDFKNFRHDISSLYHPDAFHNFPEEMKIDPDLLFGSMYSCLLYTSIFSVHSVKIPCKDVSFISTCCSTNFNYNIFTIVRILRN